MVIKLIAAPYIISLHISHNKQSMVLVMKHMISQLQSFGFENRGRKGI